MKNPSKNNYSRRNGKQYKKNSDSNYFIKDKNSSNKKNRFLTNEVKNKSDNNLKDNDKKKSNLSSSKRRKLNSKPNIDSPKKDSDFYPVPSNKKMFDDWIWGKHSVFEALTGERAINRIWCTSEIFSSEKFYILLKEHKLKGVLIEEVSWNRISQLTFGASHQGVALQLACSKTISLENLINFSKY